MRIKERNAKYTGMSERRDGKSVGGNEMTAYAMENNISRLFI